ncbi:MAG: LptF/LptG family permease [Bacteroidaceae bacterium]|nr:LptF/LptG family permease [Bacteroidaceae bacterium]
MKLPHFRIIKKLDLFIIKSFIQLLSGTFLICLFIFIMQMLWRSVDEFVGKGLDMTIIIQFFSLCSITLVSEALPLAILLASLMTFGNFGERLELLAMKAAGIPLIRIMMPILVLCITLGGISFYFQNVVAPYAQVKLFTILYSIKQTSPEVEIPEGVFYDQIKGYNLFVEKKDKETGMLYKLMIYDMSNGFENANILVADSGRIDSTPDEQNLMIQLYTGEQFSNITDQSISKRNVPYRRETFRKKIVMIPTDGKFEMKDDNVFKQNAKSQNMLELQQTIRTYNIYNDSVGHIYWKAAVKSIFNINTEYTTEDSTYMSRNNLYSINTDSIYNTATKADKTVWKKAQFTKIRQLRNDYGIKSNLLHSLDKELNKCKINWWNKITLSLACILFFFIGAPLGAIVRKGGLGYPVLISVAIFIFYYLLNTSAFKMAREGEWHTFIGSWLSTFVMAPLGILFTYQSNKDSAIFNMDSYKEFFRILFCIREKRNITFKEVIIDDPDYTDGIARLDHIINNGDKFIEKNKLNRLPAVKDIFFNEKDSSIDELNDNLEKVIEEFGNSRNKKVVAKINYFPVLSVDTIVSPFTKKWMNIASLIIFPIGILIYVRAVKFRFRLLKDLNKVKTNAQELKEILIKEKLV